MDAKIKCSVHSSFTRTAKRLVTKDDEGHRLVELQNLPKQGHMN